MTTKKEVADAHAKADALWEKGKYDAARAAQAEAVALEQQHEAEAASKEASKE